MSATFEVSRQKLGEQVALHAAQRGRCGICFGRLPPVGDLQPTGHGLTFDHVWPVRLRPSDRDKALRAKGLMIYSEGWFGNVVLAHRNCNTWKSNRAPTGCELVFLMATNAALGC